RSCLYRHGICLDALLFACLGESTVMKETLSILCFALLAFAQIALADDINSSPKPETPAVTTSQTALIWSETAAPLPQVVEKGVPKCGKLNDHVWRSGQPTREGYQRLAAKGLKTVINLRKEFPGDKDLLPKGVQYFYIPIIDNTTPTEEQGKEFVKIVSD